MCFGVMALLVPNVLSSSESLKSVKSEMVLEAFWLSTEGLQRLTKFTTPFLLSCFIPCLYILVKRG